MVQGVLNLGSPFCSASFPGILMDWILGWENLKETWHCRHMLSPGWPAYWTPEYSAGEELSSLDFTLLPIFTLLSFYSIFLTSSKCSIQTLLSFPKGEGKGSVALNWAAERQLLCQPGSHTELPMFTPLNTWAKQLNPTLSPLLNPSASLCPAPGCVGTRDKEEIGTGCACWEKRGWDRGTGHCRGSGPLRTAAAA